MDFETFSRRAERILSEIPPEYLVGVVGVEVHRERKEHPQIARYFTLGECEDDPITRLTAPEEMKSRVHLYHGSFAAVARSDPDFDWEEELRETILHEIRHHLEDRASIADLLEEDAEEEILARFYGDDELPDGWYRAGDRLESGVWRIGDDLFVELGIRGADLDGFRGKTLSLEILDETFEAEIPEDAEPDEFLTFEEEGIEREDGSYGNLHLVLTEA